jgi:hypothetical protein
MPQPGVVFRALLLADSYVRTRREANWGIGLCAALSILSHNYPLTGLMALPLYVLLMGEKRSWRAFWMVTGVIGAVYIVFMVGYLSFAGLPAATSHNHGVFAGLPGPTYLLHMFCGAFLAPFFYLFWGHYHFPILAYIAGATLLTLSLAAIWRWGGLPERHLALWALLLNLLPFCLISLTRYQRHVNQVCGPLWYLYFDWRPAAAGNGVASAAPDSKKMVGAYAGGGTPGSNGRRTDFEPAAVDRPISGNKPGGPKCYMVLNRDGGDGGTLRRMSLTNSAPRPIPPSPRQAQAIKAVRVAGQRTRK